MSPKRKAPRDLADVRLRARQALAEQEHWEQVVGQAAALHGFEYTLEGWPALADWYASIPATPPPRREQERWLASQRVLASWKASEAS